MRGVFIALHQLILNELEEHERSVARIFEPGDALLRVLIRTHESLLRTCASHEGGTGIIESSPLCHKPRACGIKSRSKGGQPLKHTTLLFT